MIGNRARCPNCSVETEVPKPSIKVVRAFVEQLPNPIPNAKQFEYQEMVLRVAKLTDHNVQLLDAIGFPELVPPCIRNAKRTLRKIADLGELAEPALDEQYLPELISRAAGHDFGGAGGSGQRQTRFWRWVDSQEEDSTSYSAGSIRKLALNAIQAIEDLRK
ncbi:hypothetical protein SH668x_002962 [Planctomicrobium sp. SH668]|uniref:hypothetical protein n=1 Tax=Planctomicrobium sp. SH668 TaxID=3448126 RepID=UPI003F5AE23E